MKNYILLAGCIILFLSSFSTAYSQSVSGKITDAQTSEPLIDAIVKIKSINAGTSTDLDGNYIMEGVPPGTYDLEFSYIGYNTKTITGVIVQAGQNIKVDVSLQMEGVTTEEIVVEATTSMANEQALLVEQKNSNKIQDGISEQQIKRAPDAAASEVLKRVTGVSIVNDKFVFIRGTTDRYSLTTLNGVQLPSSEPDKKAFSFDLFPSNLLENIIIAKSFTPDLPGSFSGGLVQVMTKEFPEALSYGFNITGSYLSGSTGKSFRSYDAGETKWLFLNSGLDNGGRQLPSNFPGTQITNVNFTPEQLKEFGREFKNNWAQTTNNAPMNTSFQLSFGNKWSLAKNPLGVFAAYSYRNSFINSDIERITYNTDFTILDSLKGPSSSYSVLQGGLLNLNYKIGDNNKIASKSTFSISSDDDTYNLDGLIRRVSEDAFESDLYYYRFSERTLYSTTLSGEHYFPALGKVNLSWVGSYSESMRNEPDTKSMTYQRLEGSTDPFYARVGSVAALDGGGRFFAKLKDFNRNLALNFDVPFIKIGENSKSKIKTGLNANTTSRSYSGRFFVPTIQGNFFLLYYGLDSIFKPEHIDINKFQYSEITKEEDSYGASEENYAGYVMFDVPYERFRFVGGARYEYNRQRVNTYGRLNQPVNADLKNIDILPSLNVTYAINEMSNMRATVSQTISRPELREISPAPFYDFFQGLNTVGNPDLERTLIQNYDLRYEIYPAAGEIFSVSLFYKHFDQPIEEVFAPGTNNPEKTFENFKGGADNYGVEFEARKNLGFLSKILKNLSLNTNITLVNSKVNHEGVQSGATVNERRMQGQAPYTINLGLFYDDYESGMSANILFNKFGRRVSEVGRNGYNDIEEDGQNLIDLSVSQKFLKMFEAKVTVKNLLGEEKRFYQDVSGVEKLVRKYTTGTGYSLTLSYKF